MYRTRIVDGFYLKVKIEIDVEMEDVTQEERELIVQMPLFHSAKEALIEQAELTEVLAGEMLAGEIRKVVEQHG